MAENEVLWRERRQNLKYYNQRSQIDIEQVDSFGAKADIQKNDEATEDPSCDNHLTWKAPPVYVLLMKKFRDTDVTRYFKEMAKWLIEEMDITIMCEPNVLEEGLIKETEFQPIASQMETWTDDTKQSRLSQVDLIVCIGGDGTLLYTSSMFQDSMPPIVSFNMGSLGFLTPFPVNEYKSHLRRVFDGKVSITLRHRLNCEIRSQNKIPLSSATLDEETCSVYPDRDSPVSPPPLTTTSMNRRPSKFPAKITVLDQDELKTKMLVMNEVVVDRGPSPYLTNLDLFCNGRPMTSVQGDGVIIATPTGSTAYSLAAGASMVHPSVPCMVISPICPHSLSFRSIVVPAGVEISVRVSPESRNSAWVAFDGRNRQEILQGDCVAVTTSNSPVASINNTGHVTDWFDSLAECLHWNVRKQQKKL